MAMGHVKSHPTISLLRKTRHCSVFTFSQRLHRGTFDPFAPGVWKRCERTFVVSTPPERTLAGLERL